MMKLSDAIEKGSEGKHQTFAQSFFNETRTGCCAFGAAYFALRSNPLISPLANLMGAFPQIDYRTSWSDESGQDCNGTVWSYVIWLNDTARKSFTDIVRLLREKGY